MRDLLLRAITIIENSDHADEHSEWLAEANEFLSWFVVGDRVRLRLPVERFPEFVLPAGLTGKVIDITETDFIVKMDSVLEELSPWDNCVIWPLEPLALSESKRYIKDHLELVADNAL